MPPYQKFYDRNFLSACDLQDDAGRPLSATVTITRVEAGSLQSPGQVKKRRAPVLSFANREKRLVVNKTNAKTIASLYGANTDSWVGRRLTIYATTTTFGREKNVPCIRVKPEIPPEKSAPTPEREAPPVEIEAEISARPESSPDQEPASPAA